MLFLHGEAPPLAPRPLHMHAPKPIFTPLLPFACTRAYTHERPMLPLMLWPSTRL